MSRYHRCDPRSVYGCPVCAQDQVDHERELDKCDGSAECPARFHVIGCPASGVSSGRVVSQQPEPPASIAAAVAPFFQGDPQWAGSVARAVWDALVKDAQTIFYLGDQYDVLFLQRTVIPLPVVEARDTEQA